jgi:hypothetical protein
MQAFGRDKTGVPKLECRISNKVYPPSAAPASLRLVKGDQGISNDEVKSVLLFPSAFSIRYSTCPPRL